MALLEIEPSRCMAVLLDTSGSVKTLQLARALGAVAAYGEAREVGGIRVVYCDASPHDAGWLTPTDLAGRTCVVGRGGTVLQAGVNFLYTLQDLPKDTPLLIITDGLCDDLHVYRPHAYLLPASLGLPFKPTGPVFYGL